jgi:hypothetical protein
MGSSLSKGAGLAVLMQTAHNRNVSDMRHARGRKLSPPGFYGGSGSLTQNSLPPVLYRVFPVILGFLDGMDS